jgi:Ni,Fe-hydrogenase I cytochrome b subunit
MFIFLIFCYDVCYDIIEHDIVNSSSEIEAMIGATSSNEGISRGAL